jgi:hypothetical protein
MAILGKTEDGPGMIPAISPFQNSIIRRHAGDRQPNLRHLTDGIELIACHGIHPWFEITDVLFTRSEE